MSTYRVMPLTCSYLDATWFMNLPEVLEPQIQTVKVAMQKDQADNLFVLSEETNTVFLNETKRLDVLNGDFCPQEQTVSLLFDLESDIFSPSSQSLDIPIKPTNVKAFEGFKIDEFEAGSDDNSEQTESESEKLESKVNVKPLEVESVEINNTGRVTMKFNKKIIAPRIEISSDNRSQNSDG